MKSSGATLPLELRNTEYVEAFNTIGRRAAVSACACLGRRGMKAGSGSIAKPSAATEVSRVGFSLKTKSAPSRAPAASITADNIRREVSVKSRSAVNSGPSSERASTVRNSLRKLLVSTATM